MSASHSRAAEFDQRIEHGLQIERRAADDLEHVGGGGLLLQRFGQIVGALLHLVEQPHVLDRDHRLVGEGAQPAAICCSVNGRTGWLQRPIAPTDCALASIGTARCVR